MIAAPRNVTRKSTNATRESSGMENVWSIRSPAMAKLGSEACASANEAKKRAAQATSTITRIFPNAGEAPDRAGDPFGAARPARMTAADAADARNESALATAASVRRPVKRNRSCENSAPTEAAVARKSSGRSNGGDLSEDDRSETIASPATTPSAKTSEKPSAPK